MSRSPDHPLGSRVTVTLHHLVDVLDAHADRLLRDRYGVTLSQYVFLATLADLDEPDVTTLAHCLRVTKAAVSKRVGSFVTAGWVRTAGDPHHGRRVVLRLTPAGASLVDVAGRAVEDAFTSAFTHVTAVDLTALHRDLDTVLATLSTTFAAPATGADDA